MIKFKERKVSKQGGSYMISLPMAWIHTMGPNLETVKVEMDNKKALRIAAGAIRQDNLDYNCNSQPAKEKVMSSEQYD